MVNVYKYKQNNLSSHLKLKTLINICEFEFSFFLHFPPLLMSFFYSELFDLLLAEPELT